MLLLTNWIWQKDNWGLVKNRCKIFKGKIKNYKKLLRILHEMKVRINKLTYRKHKWKGLIMTVRYWSKDNKMKFISFRIKYSV